MDVSKLEGAELDLAVLLAEGHAKARIVDGKTGYNFPFVIWLRPSTSWTDGGPIIERERIELFSPRSAPDHNRWEARIHPDGDLVRVAAGPTALIAAMRAFVASKAK